MVFERDSFKKAKGIWLKEYEGALNRTALFHTSISKGNNTIMNMAGQSTYQVYINGEFVHFGPSRASHGFYRVDHLNIEKYLNGGDNEIIVLVSGYHCHNFYLR